MINKSGLTQSPSGTAALLAGQYRTLFVQKIRSCKVFFWACREALRANRERRKEYLIAKQAASKLTPEGRAKYNELKQAFFDQVNIEYLGKLEESG